MAAKKLAIVFVHSAFYKLALQDLNVFGYFPKMLIPKLPILGIIFLMPNNWHSLNVINPKRNPRTTTCQLTAAYGLVYPTS